MTRCAGKYDLASAREELSLRIKHQWRVRGDVDESLDAVEKPSGRSFGKPRIRRGDIVEDVHNDQVVRLRHAAVRIERNKVRGRGLLVGCWIHLQEQLAGDGAAGRRTGQGYAHKVERPVEDAEHLIENPHGHRRAAVQPGIAGQAVGPDEVERAGAALADVAGGPYRSRVVVAEVGLVDWLGRELPRGGLRHRRPRADGADQPPIELRDAAALRYGRDARERARCARAAHNIRRKLSCVGRADDGGSCLAGINERRGPTATACAISASASAATARGQAGGETERGDSRERWLYEDSGRGPAAGTSFRLEHAPSLGRLLKKPRDSSVDNHRDSTRRKKKESRRALLPRADARSVKTTHL